MHNFPILEIDLKAITRNYSLLRKQGKGDCAAVVKANAYGLGVSEVAPALYKAGCREFFVATLEEGIELRRYLSEAPSATIYVFHGVRKNQAKDFLQYNLIPVLNTAEQINYWADAGKYALHIDTGMCRLGIPAEEKLPPVTNNLHLIISHLACSNDPAHPKNLEQLQKFREVLQGFPTVRASFANSSGVFLGKDYHFDLLRPGCSLYGISPNTHLPNPVENVVTLSAPVLQFNHITRDQTVGYGATAKVKKGSVIATVEMGYADGLMRSLGNVGYGYVGGARVPIIGRVSMDMISVDVTSVPENLRNIDTRVTLIGKEQPVDVLAQAAGTIGYEIFTKIGNRVARIYT